MGNCIELQKPVTWVDDEDDDWEPMEDRRSSRKHQGQTGNAKEKGSTEIRIKISKKQLEELLRQVDGQGLPLRQVLADLAGVADFGRLHEQERHWRPRLQSIPEVAE
ncbi:hypothetical protein Cni_G00549 [Canna indica]|uniref:Uncharacterized protein n=1 Tax=Canna indica TaxID=4628 RepID=A0AAQ3JML9_9LILI|nr:hypothetical protein Cni_G00549 [Canna indica]